MVSYRALAMRVLGKPLHVSGSSRPTAHRVTALALTAAMAASLSVPAFAGTYFIEDGDITIEVKSDGTGVTVTDGKGTYDDTLDGVIISGGSSKATQELVDESRPVAAVDEDTGDSENDLTYPDPTPVMTWPDPASDEEDAPEETVDETIEPEEKADTANGPAGEIEDEALPEDGETPENPVATLEAPAPAVPVSTADKSEDEDDDDSGVVTYESKNFVQTVTNGIASAVKNIIKIINNTDKELNVTLEDVNISGEDKQESALTISGTGDTTLTLQGENELTGGEGMAGLYHNGEGSMTITGDGRLTATGGEGGSGIQSDSNITISDGEIIAVGGDGFMFGSDGISANDMTIKGGSITAKGGSATGEMDGSMGGCGLFANTIKIEDGTIKEALGGDVLGDMADATGGDGINGQNVTMTGGTIEEAKGGNAKGENAVGGNGIYAEGEISISDSTIRNAQGGTGTEYGGNGISGGQNDDDSTTVSIAGSSVVKAAAGKATGEGGTDGNALNKGDVFDRTELTVEDVSEELDKETGYVGAVEADGTGTAVGTKPEDFNGPDVPVPAPEIPVPSGTSSDSAPAPEEIVITPAGVPGFTFTGLLGGSATVSTSVNGSTMEFRLLTLGGTLRTTLGQLRQLKAQGITHITFRTLLCTTTFAIDDLLPLGGDDTEVVLTHTGTSAKLMVGGVVR